MTKRKAIAAKTDSPQAAYTDMMREISNLNDENVTLRAELAYSQCRLRESELKLADMIRQINEFNAQGELSRLKAAAGVARESMESALGNVASQRQLECDMLRFDTQGKLIVIRQ